MDGGWLPLRWATRAGLAALCAIAIAIVFALTMDLDVPARTPAGSAVGAARDDDGAAPRRAPAPVDLTAPVAVARPGGAGGMDLVEDAHTVVFAADHDDRAVAAALVALDLRAPLVLVPTQALSSAAPSDPAGAQASEPVAEPSAAADAAREAGRRGLVRAVVIGDGVDDVARDSGADHILRLPADPPGDADAGTVIAAAAAGGAGAEQGGDADGSGEDGAGEDGAGVSGVTAVDLARYRLPAPAASGAAVLVRPDATDALATVVSARAVGHAVVPTGAEDLRADPGTGARLAELGDGATPNLVLAGAAYADSDPDAVARQAAVAARGIELPGGGQLVIDPGNPRRRRYVGLYGVPHSPALGALGEQPVARSVTRAKDLARTYQKAVGDRVEIIPCFEIIATVASASAGKDRDFSNELPVADLRRAVDAAGAAGVYVLLDLQPGRTDFTTQAKRYEALLREPHVGLALDPEWRLGPRERHLRQIGSVGIDEVNEVAGWLADLVARERLPQKMLLLHQFRLSMLPDRGRLDTSRDELAYVIQMDGQGPQGSKLDTWRAITADPPDGVQFGWKNFYDEDTPLRSPAATMGLEPRPVFVSYQ